MVTQKPFSVERVALKNVVWEEIREGITTIKYSSLDISGQPEGLQRVREANAKYPCSNYST